MCWPISALPWQSLSLEREERSSPRRSHRQALKSCAQGTAALCSCPGISASGAALGHAGSCCVRLQRRNNQLSSQQLLGCSGRRFASFPKRRKTNTKKVKLRRLCFTIPCPCYKLPWIESIAFYSQHPSASTWWLF